jgi:hypothetical protein
MASLEAKYKKAQTAVTKQQTLMRTARFTPAGYKVAHEKLQALQKACTAAKKERDAFAKQMTLS